jgi:uncharacterized membrane protein HdeD (DUF308 family)
MNHSADTTGRLDIKDIKGLCSKWGLMLALGILLIFLGSLATAASTLTTLISMIALGFLLLTAAVIHGVKAFWAQKWKGVFLQVLLGIFSGVAGALMIANPTLSALSLTLLFASYFMVTGLFKVVYALAVNLENWAWVFLSGVINVALGVLILYSWPASALWVIGLFIGIELIFTGWYSVILAWEIHKHACRIEPSASGTP